MGFCSSQMIGGEDCLSNDKMCINVLSRTLNPILPIYVSTNLSAGNLVINPVGGCHYYLPCPHLPSKSEHHHLTASNKL